MLLRDAFTTTAREVPAGALGAVTARFDDGFVLVGPRYHHGDHLGSARLMTNALGTVTWEATYLPFGVEHNPQPTTNHYKFTGKERDPESGLDYFGARYYASSTARFLTPDPIRITSKRLVNPGSRLNLYSYAANNPLLYVDPTGRDVTFFYRKPSGADRDAGHFFMAVTNQATGQVKFLDYYPQGNKGWLPKAGVFNQRMTEERLKQHAALTIQTTPEQAQQMIDAIESREKNLEIFWILGTGGSRMCVDICLDVLSILDEDLDPLFMNTPTAMWSVVFAEYSPQSKFGGFSDYEPGKDFGVPFSGLPAGTNPAVNLRILEKIVQAQANSQAKPKQKKPKPCKYKNLPSGGIQVICPG
jgi:RHS repeat-associated protein